MQGEVGHRRSGTPMGGWLPYPTPAGWLPYPTPAGGKGRGETPWGPRSRATSFIYYINEFCFNWITEFGHLSAHSNYS